MSWVEALEDEGGEHEDSNEFATVALATAKADCLINVLRLVFIVGGS